MSAHGQGEINGRVALAKGAESVCHWLCQWKRKRCQEPFPETKIRGMPETKVIAVGMALAGHPPHRSVRAELPHTALTLDADWQTSR